MQIIKTDSNQFIKLEGVDDLPIPGEHGKWFVWGYRWNKNENRWGKQLMGFWLKSWELVYESEIPVDKLKPMY